MTFVNSNGPHRSLGNERVGPDDDFYRIDAIHAAHNQKVVATTDGIFMTYSRRRVPVDPAQPEVEAVQWRLVRRTGTSIN